MKVLLHSGDVKIQQEDTVLVQIAAVVWAKEKALAISAMSGLFLVLFLGEDRFQHPWHLIAYDMCNHPSRMMVRWTIVKWKAILKLRFTICHIYIYTVSHIIGPSQCNPVGDDCLKRRSHCCCDSIPIFYKQNGRKLEICSSAQLAFIGSPWLHCYALFWVLCPWVPSSALKKPFDFRCGLMKLNDMFFWETWVSLTAFWSWQCFDVDGTLFHQHYVDPSEFRHRKVEKLWNCGGPCMTQFLYITLHAQSIKKWWFTTGLNSA